MKKTIYAICLLSICCGSTFGQTPNQSLAERNTIGPVNGPTLVFPRHDQVYDFGGIPLGESIPYQFEITNSGNVPLIVAGMKCESTNVKCKWPDKPVKPGKKAYLTVTYTARGDVGSFKNDILITTNAAPAPYPFIKISGAIIPAGSSYAPAAKKESKNGVSIEVKNTDALPGTVR